MFENGVLRSIFGSKKEEATGGRRNLRNGELHNMYRSSDIIRMNKSRNMW
jgi:hypothetical protein